MAKTRTETILGHEAKLTILVDGQEVEVDSAFFIEDVKVWVDLDALLKAADAARA